MAAELRRAEPDVFELATQLPSLATALERRRAIFGEVTRDGGDE